MQAIKNLYLRNVALYSYSSAIVEYSNGIKLCDSAFSSLYGRYHRIIYWDGSSAVLEYVPSSGYIGMAYV